MAATNSGTDFSGLPEGRWSWLGLGVISTCKVGKQDWAPIAISIGGYNSTTKGGYKIYKL